MVNPEDMIKVVIMGMENAGKSTIVDVLMNKVDTPLTPPDMHPTKGVVRKTLNNAIVWDFGGQELYRNEYLADPDSYLRSIAYLYYVVDVQDYYRHYSSLMYFMAVFPSINKFCPDAEMVFLFNKMDPGYDPTTKNLKEKFLNSIEPYLEGRNKSFVVYDTTILDLNSIKTAFHRALNM